MGEFPAFRNAATLERRAQEIADPIQRLRYLRQATGLAPRPGPTRRWRLAASLLLVVLAIPLQTFSDSDANLRRTPALPLPSARSGPVVPNVWLVDKSNDFELYSNGLRIENQLSVSGHPRWYPLIGRESGAVTGPHRSDPAGIVFHTTESDQAPFEQDQNHALKRLGRELLLYVRNRRSYHFVIDRFGRVHRIVAESDAASHAGHSVWADGHWLYVNLNESFLGVALEGRDEPDKPPVNQAQIHAARVLTEMLRSRYNLPAENCVTHAQVSVNPDNMRIGWHTDWGAGFPFREVGLPDNYERSSPVVSVFGFSYDATYGRLTGPGVWKGLALAEEAMREAAALKGMELAEYRKLLQKRYWNQVAALKAQGANEAME